MASLRVLLGFWPTMSDEFLANSTTGFMPWLGEMLCGTFADMAIFVETSAGQYAIFSTTIDSNRFVETTLQSLNEEKQRHLRRHLTFLAIYVTADEHERVLSTCRACVRVKMRYNTRDTMLMNVPFRTPVEKGLFEISTVHNAQAAILILRECLGPDHPALPIVGAVHSRTTSADCLYRALLEGGIVRAPALH